MHRAAFILAAVAAIGAGAAAQTVRERPLATRDSFRIGDAGALCTAQYAPMDSIATSMFDRAYAIVCRDAATTVGKLFALRTTAADAEAAFLNRRDDLECAAPVAAEIDGASGARLAECTRRADGLPQRIYFLRSRNQLFVADGLRGYDSALALGLRTLAAGRPVPGTVEVAVTEAGDPNAFARIQAGVLNADSAAAEGLGRNNAGSYAEAAEFFERLLVDARATSSGGATETLLNYGLQQSNLGNYPVAEDSFDQAERRGAGGDAVNSRLLRNYRAINLMNQRDPAGAIAALDAPVVPVTAGSEELAQGQITAELAERINRAAASNRRFGNNGSLTPVERAQILDGQGALLRGTALRRLRKYPDALAALDHARTALVAVRGGRIPSTAFLQSEALAQASLIAEARGDRAAAIANLEQSVRLVQTAYPGTATSMSTKARLAAALLRAGQQDRALALYGEVVSEGPSVPGGTIALNVTLRPYLAALAARADKDPQAVAALFTASQLFVRPGLSQTQAVLARELSGGSDAASQLFRESLNRTREVARAGADVADLAALNPAEGSADAVALTRARERLATLEKEQVALQSQLAAFPRYRVLNAQTVTLADLQKGLRAGEGYYELRYVGPDVYAIFVTADRAQAFKVAASAKAIDGQVAALRSTIVRTERGQVVTEPYDITLARKLYVTLFGPVDEQVRGLKHLIWEADGGLLSLPPNVLVTDQASVDRYQARMKRADADPFDFRGTAWLGRDRDVSTAVSVRGFLDVRTAARSPAPKAYFGLGNNAIPAATATFASSGGDGCAWPATTWAKPIAGTELIAASGMFGTNNSALLMGPAFSDTAILGRKDLSQYRVLHFATHGLVTAARPGCPARPALLTSFGDSQSDGLLTFREIYDLRLDADLVILSACDTARGATASATREAGLATGGDFALDGLVRAFVGAGARTVVASHWPIPDDFQATQRLIMGMLERTSGRPIAGALRDAEVRLMDDPQTSHPFYWGAFAVVGDGSRVTGTSPGA